MNITIENIITLVSLIAAMSAIFFNFSNNKKANQKEDKTQGEVYGALSKDITYIKDTVKNINDKLKESDAIIYNHEGRIVHIETILEIKGERRK